MAFGSSMKDDPVYTLEDVFETFPFPDLQQFGPQLAQCGAIYYGFRADLMVRKNEGMTTSYNRFHDPNEDSTDILRLRELHDSMDRVALDAFGWTDIQPKCEFIPEFDDEGDEDEIGRPRKKKYRYRWPDEIRDEVLARLLELNRKRTLEEGQPPVGELYPSAPLNDKPKKAGKATKSKKPKYTSSQAILAMGEGEA